MGTLPVITIVGLGPAGPDLLTTETVGLLGGDSPVWLRTERHPAAAGLVVSGTFDDTYEAGESFDEVYRTIVERLVGEAQIHGRIVYAVPGSPTVAEHTVELLRADARVDIDVRAALSFTDLCWAALGIDPMAEAVTVVDAHRITSDTSGRLGPFLVTQVHSDEVLDDLIFALDDARPPTATILQGLGTADAVVKNVPWDELAANVNADHLTSVWIPRVAEPVAASFVRFDELVRRLRADCPWDAKQTHASLRQHLLEETYEVLEAIDAVSVDPNDGYVELEEELGDLLFQVFFHSRLAAEAGHFSVADVADGIHDKLVMRHPHVFDGADAETTVQSWEVSKQAEKGRSSVMDGIPAALPALLHALKTQKRAAAVGFTGPDLQWAFDDVRAELDELLDDPSEHELGDLLFAGVQVARMLDIDPENALREASKRFDERFRVVELQAKDDDVSLSALSQDELHRRWQSAKLRLSDVTDRDP